MKRNNISIFLTTIFSIIMFLTGIGFILKKEYYSLSNLIAIYFSYLLYIHLENNKKFKVRNSIKVLVMITVIAHNLFGEYFDLYATTKWFDKGLHIFGTFSFTLFCYAIIESRVEYFSKSKMFIFILSLSIGITVGVFFENLEFILDTLFKTKNQNGLIDTNLDLIFNTFGAAVAGILVAFRKISIRNE